MSLLSGVLSGIVLTRFDPPDIATITFNRVGWRIMGIRRNVDVRLRVVLDGNRAAYVSVFDNGARLFEPVGGFHERLLKKLSPAEAPAFIQLLASSNGVPISDNINRPDAFWAGLDRDAGIIKLTKGDRGKLLVWFDEQLEKGILS